MKMHSLLTPALFAMTALFIHMAAWISLRSAAAGSTFFTVSQFYRFDRQTISAVQSRLMHRALGKNGKIKYESSI